MTASGRQAPGLAPVDCDLATKALESHHMVMVMAVLVTCPHVRRLRLDGNKVRTRCVCV